MSKTAREKDPLTGLPRKAEFDDLLGTAIGDSGGDSLVSLAFFDVDRFLELNNKYGHEKGDEVLLSVAKLFSVELKENRAQMCRVGGDEFAVILRKMEKEEAFLRLERIRTRVPDLKGFEDMDPKPTISIGVATYPDDGATRQEIVRKADDALFRAKSGGRNRVALAREEKKVPKTSHFTQGQLDRLAALSTKEGVGEAELLREALDDLLKKYSSRID